MSDAPDLNKFEPPEYLLAKLNTQIRDLMRFALRPHGLKLVEWRVLQCLHQHPPGHTVADLAELAVIERTATSRLIDKMVGRGLVQKQTLEDDRRFTRITITPEGRAIYLNADTAAQRARLRLFEGISDDEVAELLRMLHRLQLNSERPQRGAQIYSVLSAGR